MPVITHYNIRRTLDIYGNVQSTDLGAANKQINKILDAHRKELPRGSFVRVRGQIETMQTSYFGLIAGLAFSIVLVYLLIVVNFSHGSIPLSSSQRCPRRWPASSCFSLWTRTTLSVPALIGRHHVYGSRDSQQYSGGIVRQGEADASRGRDPRGGRGPAHSLSSRLR